MHLADNQKLTESCMDVFFNFERMYKFPILGLLSIQFSEFGHSVADAKILTHTWGWGRQLTEKGVTTDDTLRRHVAQRRFCHLLGTTDSGKNRHITV